MADPAHDARRPPRPTGRRLLAALSTGSFAMLLVTITLAIAGHSAEHDLEFTTAARVRYRMHPGRNGLTFQSYHPWPNAIRLRWAAHPRGESGYLPCIISDVKRPPILSWSRWGLWGESGPIKALLEYPDGPVRTNANAIAFVPHWSPTIHYRSVTISYGLLCAAMAILPITSFLMRVRRRGQERRRRAANLCPACGYDLRATPTRCPECGHVP